jgi:hypothetical protein
MWDHIEFYKKTHKWRFTVDQENQVYLRLLGYLFEVQCLIIYLVLQNCFYSLFFLFNCLIFPFVNFFREMMVRERDSYIVFVIMYDDFDFLFIF